MNERQFVETLGQTDRMFTGPYKTSYFKNEFDKYQYCSNQIMKLQFDKRYYYGDEVLIDLYRNGDVVTMAYLQLNFSTPGISVVDSLGTYVIEYVRLEYDTHVIETIYGEFLEIQNDIHIPQGKQGALSQLTGKNKTIMNSTYSIKLPFTCFQNGFPLCALTKNPVLRFKFRKASEFAPSITTPLQLSGSILVNYAFLPPYQKKYLTETKMEYLIEQTHRVERTVQSAQLLRDSKLQTVNVSSNVTIGTSNSNYSFSVPVPYDYYQNQTSNVTLALQVTDTSPSLSNYTIRVNGTIVSFTGTATASSARLIYTGTLTRASNANVNIQWNTNVTLSTANCIFSGNYFTNECRPYPIATNFVFPVKELFFVIQNNTASSYDFTLDGTYDQISALRIMFNGNDIIPYNLGVPSFLRQLQGLENYTRSPDRFFYMYPFSLDPENTDPSGSINMTSISRQQFDFVFRHSTNDRNVRIYSRVYNFMTIEKGHVHMAYEVKNSDAPPMQYTVQAVTNYVILPESHVEIYGKR